MTAYTGHGICDECEADVMTVRDACCSICGATVGLTKPIRWDAEAGRYVEATL